MLMLSLSFVALIVAECGGPTRAPPDEAVKALSRCARLDVTISARDQGGNSRYTITDKAVIEGLAKRIDPKLPTSVLRGKSGTASYVSFDAFTQAANTKPAVTFTILLGSNKLLFEDDGKSYEAELPDNELDRRLRQRDLDFPARRKDDPAGK